MKRWKRGVAAALAALMLLSVAPITALADELEQTPPAPETGAGAVDPAEEVTYSTGIMEVTVGYDEERALEAQEETEEWYMLFEDDGSFAIPLGFFGEVVEFPYTMEFHCQGKTVTRAFASKDDTQEVGGHVFSLLLADDGPEEDPEPDAEDTGLAFQVGDRVFQVVPTTGQSSTFSIQPVAEKYGSANLYGIFGEELKSVTALSYTENGSTESITGYWKIAGSTDSPVQFDASHPIDLSLYAGRNSVKLEIIDNGGDPLKTEGVTRYIVTVSLLSENYYRQLLKATMKVVPEAGNVIVPSVYYSQSQDEDTRRIAFSSNANQFNFRTFTIQTADVDGEHGDKALLKLAVNDHDSPFGETSGTDSRYSALFTSLKFDVYVGTYRTAEEAEAAANPSTDDSNQPSLDGQAAGAPAPAVKITDQVTGGGYDMKKNERQYFTAVFKRGDNGDPIYVYNFSAQVNLNYASSFSAENLEAKMYTTGNSETELTGDYGYRYTDYYRFHFQALDKETYLTAKTKLVIKPKAGMTGNTNGTFSVYKGVISEANLSVAEKITEGWNETTNTLTVTDNFANWSTAPVYTFVYEYQVGTDSAAVTKRCFVPFSAIVSPDSVSCYPDEVSMMGTDAGGALNNPMKLDYSHQEYDSVKRYYVNVYESFSANSADFEKAQLQIKWNSSSVKEMTDNGGTLSAYKGIASSPEDLKAENKLSDNAWTEDGAEGAKTKILTVEDKFGDADNPAVYTIVYQYKRAYLKDDGTTEMADTYNFLSIRAEIKPYTVPVALNNWQLYKPITSGGNTTYSPVTENYEVDGSTYTFTTSYPNPAGGDDGKYCAYFEVGNVNPDWQFTATDYDGMKAELANTFIAKAAASDHQLTAQEMESLSGADNIKDKLFASHYGTNADGYPLDFSGAGKVITIQDVYGNLSYFTIKTVAGTEHAPVLSSDTYFQITGASAQKTEGSYGNYASYIMKPTDDSYYDQFKYQTVLLLNESNGPVSDTIYPTFWTAPKVRAFASHNSEAGTEVHSGQNEMSFDNSGTPSTYSSAAENGTTLRNYWVTFVTQHTGGAKLFVNGATNAADAHKDEETGLPTRVLYLDADHGYHHDIFFANIGDAEMADLKVELSADAQNVALDDYWKIGTVTKLAAFTSTDKTTQYGELSNVSKIRLVPAKNDDGSYKTGPISGTLTITGGGETVTIKLSGEAAKPKIITDTLPNAVKYVHYSAMIQTDNMSDDTITFRTGTGWPIPGNPDVGLKPNGEIYGVPDTTGTYTFSVAAYSGEAKLDEKTYTLTIVDNLHQTVWNATDVSYDVSVAIPNEDGGSTIGSMNHVDSKKGLNQFANSDMVFESQGPFAEFIEIELDGVKLTEGTDYTKEEGSTRITLKTQTLKNRSSGTHTLSAEFRVGGDKDGVMHRSSQNYVLDTNGQTGGGGTGGGSTGGGSTGGGSTGGGSTGGGNWGGGTGGNTGGSTGNGGNNTNPGGGNSNPTPATPFVDVPSNSWFNNDVAWAYENGFMIGVSNTEFEPYSAIGQGTVVTVLARMGNVDLSRYSAEQYSNITPNQWYSSAAVWATQTGMLPDYTVFMENGSTSRGSMAIMLVKYLRSMGFDTSVPYPPVLFSDAELMNQEEYNAFQVLYHYGIFLGVGDMYMDPVGTTSRCEFATLVHRLYTLLEQK